MIISYPNPSCWEHDWRRVLWKVGWQCGRDVIISTVAASWLSFFCLTGQVWKFCSVFCFKICVTEKVLVDATQNSIANILSLSKILVTVFFQQIGWLNFICCLRRLALLENQQDGSQIRYSFTCEVFSTLKKPARKIFERTCWRSRRASCLLWHLSCLSVGTLVNINSTCLVPVNWV